MSQRNLRKIVWVDPREGIYRGDLTIQHDYVDRVDVGETLAPDTDPATLAEFWIPGFVDLHSDAIEKTVEPRPRVHFPLPFALNNMDRCLVASGVTSCFHAISFAGKEMGLRSPQKATALIEALDAARHHSRCRNFIHVRYEVSDLFAPAEIKKRIEGGLVDLLSFMDHCPGQGQFRRDKDFIRYLMLTYSKTEKKSRALLREKRRTHAGAKERVRDLAGLAKVNRVKLVSHDMDNPAEAKEWAALGVSISEFPMTLQAAEASLAAGMATFLGAPNLVRGESSGNGVKASEAIEAGFASGLCSDYLPASLMDGLQKTLRLDRHRLTLPQAVAFFTRNPAEAANQKALGRIGAGYPADLLRLAWEGDNLRLKETIVAGKTVFFEAD